MMSQLFQFFHTSMGSVSWDVSVEIDDHVEI
jgi:hypothetical protein